MSLAVIVAMIKKYSIFLSTGNPANSQPSILSSFPFHPFPPIPQNPKIHLPCQQQSTDHFQYPMKGASPSTLNREQQVKVVIRLKPDDPQSRHPKCVHLTTQQNELVVQTDNKKQSFVFDHIAPPYASQLDIYRMIGEEIVQMSFEGYNCCLFAYGQTGAGKTYSVMGSLAELNADFYSDLRGLLPRIVEDVFKEAENLQAEKCSISCSFMEVYNEQIFDLLSPEKRIHQIREDFKRGVFVQGITEKKITSYKQTMELILDGEKTRKMASTAMNNQSSRSHAIFTVMVETQTMQGEVKKVRKSKLNIVDLAGSQRVKHTHVMGQQLKQGCNINKSLHVLGNVINSLVESAKKKKHIPFRDSKLTHYLKDSLGGNSITKLLANIHTNKMYLGDTLSTLMFAKRAKILKMKIEVNQNVTENFDSLRKEVKRLREELAQARYFKGDTQRTQRPSFQDDSELVSDKLVENQGQIVGKSQVLSVFEENELHYKALMEVYEDHLAGCSAMQQGGKGKHQMTMVSEWKNLEKKNTALAGLVKRFPAFTTIYKENLLLRDQDKPLQNQPPKYEKLSPTVAISSHHNCIDKSQLQQIITQYQSLIQDMQSTFSTSLETLQKSYIQLQHECKLKDKRLKEFMKRQGLPPDVEDLKNQNEYLHLNILNLENEIYRLEEHEHIVELERREEKKSHRKSMQESDGNVEEDDQGWFVMEQLRVIKEEAMKEMEQVQREREQTDVIIEQLKKRINALTAENARLQIKSSRSRSHKRQPKEMFQSRASSSNNLKTSFTELFFAEQSQIIDLCKKSQQEWEEELKQIQDSHKGEMESIRAEIQQKQTEIQALRSEVIQTKDYQKIEEEFGKNLSQILNEYRENARRLTSSKSMAHFYQYKQMHPKIEGKIQEKSNKRINVIESKLIKQKDPPRLKKEQPLSARNSMPNSKKTQHLSSK